MSTPFWSEVEAYSSERSVFLTLTQCSISLHQHEIWTTKPKPWAPAYGNGWRARVRSMWSVTSSTLSSGSFSLIRALAIRVLFWGEVQAALRKFSGGWGSSRGNRPMAKRAVGRRWTVGGGTSNVIHLLDQILPSRRACWAGSDGMERSMQGDGGLFGCTGGGIQVGAGEFGASFDVAAARAIARTAFGRKWER